MTTTQFHDQTVVVTGAAHGIGAQLATVLLQQGARVVVMDRDETALLASEKRWREDGYNVQAEIVDITDETSVERAMHSGLQTTGRLDVLVNCAGLIFDSRCAIDEMQLETWQRSFDVNATGTFLMCREAVRVMKPQKYGRIINIASAMAYSGAPGRSHYISSKAAVLGLTAALARELGTYNITVNAVAPGLVDSGERARNFVPDAIFDFERQRRAITRDMTTNDLVSAVLMFASRDSGMITGQTLVVDGGVILK